MTEHPAPLADRLAALAAQLRERAWADPGARGSALLVDAAALDEFAAQAEREYVRVVGDDEIPTALQALALGRFLRPAFRDRTVGAHVCRGGAGLPQDYLYVRLTDGYEAGVAPDGRVST